MKRLDIFNGEVLEGARRRLAARLQELGIERTPEPFEVVAFSLKWFEDHFPDKLADEHARYLRLRETETRLLKVIVSDDTEARIQRIGDRLSHLEGIRSQVGYNQKMVTALALLVAGKGSQEEA